MALQTAFSAFVDRYVAEHQRPQAARPVVMPRSRVRRKPTPPKSSVPETPAWTRRWVDWIARFLAFRAADPAMPPLARPGWSHIVAAAVAAAAFACAHGAMAWHMFTLQGNDYVTHVGMAEALYRKGEIVTPHFLYHLLVAGVYATRMASSFLLAGRLVVIGAYALTGVVVYGALWVVFHGDRRIGRAPVLLAATGALLVAQPIQHTLWVQIGYLWNEPYNAPTYTLLRPFAMGAFFLTVQFLFGRRRPGWRILIVFFLTVAAGTLAKPSYLMCLLPAAALLALLRILRRAPVSPGALLIGLALPACAVLSWQYLRAYSGDPGLTEYQDTIVWAPLRVMRHWATDLHWKLLASVAFPLAVLLLHWKTALRDGMIQLAWLTFFFGASYAYLLSETIRWTHGNFVWSAYISLSMIFIASMIFWLRQVSAVSQGSWLWLRELACLGVLSAHVVAGVVMDEHYLRFALGRIWSGA